MPCSSLHTGIKGIRVQFRDGSVTLDTVFMRRRLACPACLQRGAPPSFDLDGLESHFTKIHPFKAD